MTFKQLEAFYFSARLLSFSAAAQRLCTTQSAISKRVAELESAVGGIVQPHGLATTPLGMRLLPLAEETLQLRKRIEDEANAEKGVQSIFRLGITELTALTWLTRLVTQLRMDFPSVKVEPVVDAGLPLLQRLENNQLDLAILPGSFWGQQYLTIPIGQVEEPWVASPALGIPGRPLRPEEFANYPALEQSAGSGKSLFYESWHQQHGFRFNNIFATNSLPVLRELTIGGFGISQLAMDFVREDIDAGLLQIVRSDPMPPPMTYCAVYRRDNYDVRLKQAARLAAQLCDFSMMTARTLAARAGVARTQRCDE